MTNVREAFFDMARQLGLTTVFGNPGSTEETMLEHYPNDFKYVLALQEANAIAMADAYSQITAKPVLVNLHTAAGMGNAVGNLETAWYNRAPLIVTAGQQTREMLLHEPYLVNPDIHDIARPFVKWAYETTRPDDAPGALMRAYALAMQAPRGPVFLSIPMDDFEKPYTGNNTVRSIQGRAGADPVLLAPVIEALKASKAPVLVIGGAVDQLGGWEDGIRLAEKLKAHVWAPPTEGMPGFPEIHPLYQGTLPSAIKPAGEALRGADVVVVIGAPVFRYYPYVAGEVIPQGVKLFQITDNPADIGSAWVGDGFLADPARACAVLADALPSTERTAPPPKQALPLPESGKIITPDYLYHTLAKVRPEGSVIAQESLSTMKALRLRLPTSRSRSFLSMSSGVLGYGLPAGVGAALALRSLGENRKVLCILGDGSSNYVIQSLWTAAQHEADVLFVILRNGAYNILKSFQNLLKTPGVPGLDLPGIDFVHLANGYGLTAERVSDPTALEEVLRAGVVRKGPHLIEVTVDATVPPLI
jgi:benzoylformate decarboxylase